MRPVTWKSGALSAAISAPKSHKPTMKTLLQGVAQLLFVIASLCFFVGGRAISTFTKTERVLAEMEGIGLAVLCGALGFWAKTGSRRP